MVLCDMCKKKFGMETTKTEFPAVCKKCNKDCTVPFEPSPGSSVLCRECFKESKGR